jgi:hypothetical protein
MKSKAHIVVLALIMALPLGAQAREAKVLEDAREVAPAMLTLPSKLDGGVAIQGCGSCKRLTFQFAREVRFFVARTEVTYGDMQNFLRTHPKNSVLVVSPIGKSIITRISASDAPSAQ